MLEHTLGQWSWRKGIKLRLRSKKETLKAKTAQIKSPY